MRRPCRISVSEATRPFVLRPQRAQLALDLDRIVASHETDPVRDAQHVTIDWQTGHTERMAQHDVCRLAPYARQLR